MTLESFWKKLSTVTLFSRKAYTKAWSGEGTGEVIITQESASSLLFAEKGFWKSGPSFTNLFRWTLRPTLISLEHLRFGSDHSVFLFDLHSPSEGLLTPKIPHLCKEDCYQLTIRWNDQEIQLNWEVFGPQKADRIDCLYFLES